jgi:hypothetical protein
MDALLHASAVPKESLTMFMGWRQPRIDAGQSSSLLRLHQERTEPPGETRQDFDLSAFVISLSVFILIFVALIGIIRLLQRRYFSSATRQNVFGRPVHAARSDPVTSSSIDGTRQEGGGGAAAATKHEPPFYHITLSPPPPPPPDHHPKETLLHVDRQNYHHHHHQPMAIESAFLPMQRSPIPPYEDDDDEEDDDDDDDDEAKENETEENGPWSSPHTKSPVGASIKAVHMIALYPNVQALDLNGDMLPQARVAIATTLALAV